MAVGIFVRRILLVRACILDDYVLPTTKQDIHKMYVVPTTTTPQDVQKMYVVPITESLFVALCTALRRLTHCDSGSFWIAKPQYERT